MSLTYHSILTLCLVALVTLTGCMEMAGGHWIGPKGTEGKGGFTALHSAAMKGQADTVRTLLDAGADPSIKNEQGFTPIELTKNVIIMNILMKAEEKRYMTAKKPPLSLPEKLTVKSGVVDIHDIPDFKATHQRNDLAVVMGIEKYQDVPKSDYSHSDASIVKDYLKALGFQERNIEFITDERATKSAFEKSIEAWLPNRAKRDSSEWGQA